MTKYYLFTLPCGSSKRTTMGVVQSAILENRNLNIAIVKNDGRNDWVWVENFFCNPKVVQAAIMGQTQEILRIIKEKEISPNYHGGFLLDSIDKRLIFEIKPNRIHRYIN